MTNLPFKAAIPLIGILAMLLLGGDGNAQEWQRIQVRADDKTPDKPADPNWLPEFLKRLPQPPDEPASLYKQPASQSNFACEPVTGPYFQVDPLLDPPGFPRPGWYAIAEAEYVFPHIFSSLTGRVTAGGRAPDAVQLENRGLNGTVAPRLEIGYRLPSGFGGFSLAYRTLSASGNSNTWGPDGVAALNSRLNLNVADFDYESREFTPNDLWTMRWRFGLRAAYVYYDSVLNQSADVASAGSGILQQHATNMFSGVGPHAAVELTRQLGSPDIRLLGRAEFASLFGRIKQNISETALDPIAASGVSWGETPVSSSQTSPAVNGLFGLNWRPSRWPSLDCLLGYQYESWWNVGRFSGSQGFQRSRGTLSLQGVVFQARFNY